VGAFHLLTALGGNASFNNCFPGVPSLSGPRLAFLPPQHKRTFVDTARFAGWIKVTIHPRFSTTLPIFNDVYQNKNQFSRSRICANIDKLHYFTVRILILTCFLAIFFVHNTQKIVSGHDSAPYPAGRAHDTLPDPQVGPPTARKYGAPYIVTDCGAQITVTLGWMPFLSPKIANQHWQSIECK